LSDIIIIIISQGSVATRFRCGGGIFSDNFTAHFCHVFCWMRPYKNFENGSIFWWSCGNI